MATPPHPPPRSFSLLGATRRPSHDPLPVAAPEVS
jgi:hypothetical protein